VREFEILKDGAPKEETDEDEPEFMRD
jgi:hypothetical protein